ncbi:hypothetical protein WA158_005207 [Blastocystis sp. Blastoise]
MSIDSTEINDSLIFFSNQKEGNIFSTRYSILCRYSNSYLFEIYKECSSYSSDNICIILETSNEFIDLVFSELNGHDLYINDLELEDQNSVYDIFSFCRIQVPNAIKRHFVHLSKMSKLVENEKLSTNSIPSSISNISNSYDSSINKDSTLLIDTMNKIIDSINKLESKVTKVSDTIEDIRYHDYNNIKALQNLIEVKLNEIQLCISSLNTSNSLSNKLLQEKKISDDKTSLSLFDSNPNTIQSNIFDIELDLSTIMEKLDELNGSLENTSSCLVHSLMLSLTDSFFNQHIHNRNNEIIFHDLSLILTSQDQLWISTLFPSEKKWRLCYRMSEHHKSVDCWRIKCRERDCLLILKVKGGKTNDALYSFGAYTSVGWGNIENSMNNKENPTLGWRKDPQLFLFTLTNPFGYNHVQIPISPDYISYGILCNDPHIPILFSEAFGIYDDNLDGRFDIGSVQLFKHNLIFPSPYPETGNSFFSNSGSSSKNNDFSVVEMEVYSDYDSFEKKEKNRSCCHQQKKS